MLVAAVVLLIAHTAPAATVTGLVFVPVLTLLLALCQGASLVPVTAARIRLPYAWVADVLCGLVMVAADGAGHRGRRVRGVEAAHRGRGLVEG